MVLKPVRVVLLLLPCIGLFAPTASATPLVFSQSILNLSTGNTTPVDSGSKASSSIQVGSDLATSFINLNAGTMGAEITASDGNLNSGQTLTRHDDDWNCHR